MSVRAVAPGPSEGAKYVMPACLATLRDQCSEAGPAREVMVLVASVWRSGGFEQ